MVTLPLLVTLAALVSGAAALSTSSQLITARSIIVDPNLAAVTSASSNTYTAGAASLPATSYSYTFTVTTPTTIWHAPTFAATSSPTPACSNSVCPSLDGKYCTDAGGDTYGVLCDTRFSGTVITNNGKKMLMERNYDEVEGDQLADKSKRDYAGTFDNCADFCDEYDDPSAPCTGVGYHDGYCMAYDTITGTFPLAGGIAAVRQTGDDLGS